MGNRVKQVPAGAPSSSAPQDIEAERNPRHQYSRSFAKSLDSGTNGLSLARHASDTLLVRETRTQRRQSSTMRLAGIGGHPEVITITPQGKGEDDEELGSRVTVSDTGDGDSLELPLLAALAEDGDGADPRLRFAFGASWVVNVLLLLAKIYVYALTSSKAVLASLADSAVDLASQGVIAVADILMRQKHPRFPVGRTRLEAVGVIMCAVIMSLSSFEVVQFAAVDLYYGWVKGNLPQLEMCLTLYIILAAATGLKLALYIYCVQFRKRSDSMAALAEDHLNDVLSNAVAVATAAAAAHWRTGWWIDPVGALLISAYIIWRWTLIVLEQVNKLVGQGAPEDFVQKLEAVANAHHGSLSVDVIRAYHFGTRFMVEMEVVMPADMTVAESHDIALFLQHKVERFDEVERAFVHVDYQKREEPEHKLERTLLATTPRTASGLLRGSSSRSSLNSLE